MASLPGTVRSATPGAAGFDCSTTLSQAALDAAVAANFTFCLRYVSYGETAQSDDLTTDEATRILNAGLALMAMYPWPGDAWPSPPSAALGTRNGARTVAHAQGVGLPGGVNIFLDLEGVPSTVSAGNVIAYCNTWYDVVEAAGYIPGIYVGDSTQLSGDQLYNDLKMQHYWKSGSDVPDITTRGYQMVQSIPGNPPSIGGQTIDTNVTMTDRLGGNAQWLAPN